MFDPVFHLEPKGRLANLMIQYMVALKFGRMAGGGRISNISIPAWRIDHPRIESDGPVAIERREQRIDLPALADQVWSGQIQRVEWTGFGQRMENFLPPEQYQDIFVSPFKTPMGFGPEDLVCPIRAEDILYGPNPDYVLTPVEFYRDIVAMTGLTPVFIGQTARNLYMDRISASFPNAIFREPQDDPLIDFETIRQSRNVVIGVSTYSWLAAWLSRGADNIFLTVNGLFNPMQKADVDLLSLGDPGTSSFFFQSITPCHWIAPPRCTVAWRHTGGRCRTRRCASSSRPPRASRATRSRHSPTSTKTSICAPTATSQRLPGNWDRNSSGRIMPDTAFQSVGCPSGSIPFGTPANTRSPRSRSPRAITPNLPIIIWRSARPEAIAPIRRRMKPDARSGAART